MQGETLSHYRILDRLGEGGMGVVYRAQDLVLERVVALKVMNRTALADPSQSQRFLQEARSAAALHHPNIATIFEANAVEGTAFIAMEYVEGESLKARLGRPLPLEDALRIAIDVVSGLQHAHANRVVHRDLKPENILIAADRRAKILDFGLAKVLLEPAGGAETTQATVAMGLTVRGEILGTPAYMSPEQARGLAVDFRTDIFSFGCILHEMVTGQRAFVGTTAIDVLSAILRVSPAPPSRSDARLPPELDRIVTRCLQKDPEARYADTGELLRDLQAVAAGGRASAAQIAARRVRRLVGVRTAAAAGGVAVLAALLAVWRPWAERRAATAPAADAGTAGSTTTSERPNWILVADFQGAGVEPELAVATRELVTAALAQSGAVTPIPHAMVVRGLKMSDLPDTTRVVGDVARKIAFRASARAYVSGRIDKVLTGYSVVVDVNDSETNSRTVTVREVAKNDAEVITTLDKIGRELRKKLGEKSDAVRGTSPLRDTLTPSFEAFRSYVHAMDLQNARQYGPSNQALRRALALDGGFAVAWYHMGVNYYNMNLPDSSRVAFDEARRRPERFPESLRLSLEVLQAAAVDYDLDKAADLYEALTRQPGASSTQWNNRGTVLFGLGRYEEALAAQQRATQVEIFGPTAWGSFNQFRTLLQLGKMDEAHALLDRLMGTNLALAQLQLATAGGDWEAAERLAHGSETATDEELSFESKLVLASLRARQGAVRSALRDLSNLTAGKPVPFWTDLARVARIYLASASGLDSEAGAAAAPGDTTTEGWIVRGIAAAARGDAAAAARCRDAVKTKPIDERRRCAVDEALLEGWIAFDAGRWDDVTIALGPATTAGPGPWFVGRPAIRWLVAQAHERAGRTDEAIRAYERVLDPTRQHHDVWTWSPLLWGFAQQRLAVLQAKAGQADEARTHLAALESAWREPDPALRRLLDTARRAVADATKPS